MAELNGNSQGPSQGPSVNNPSIPDFTHELRQAQVTGNFDFVLDTAKKSHRMLTDFHDVIQTARFAGKDATAVAMGLNFLENMMNQSTGQINALKRAEKESQQAVKSALKAQAEGPSMTVIDPEKPAEPTPETPSA